MTVYRIENTLSGAFLGNYEGATEAEALDALARDAGYTDYASLCDISNAESGEIHIEPLRTGAVLYCTSGCVRYGDSAEAMLAEYNRNGRVYEIRTDANGDRVLWHKGRNCAVGTFK